MFPLVDVCNLVSLRTLLPISLVDLSFAATNRFCVRRGRAGESYVFNAGGQAIALEDLLLLARLPGDTPCANAVKDSLATKLTPESRDVLAVVYAPLSAGGVGGACGGRNGGVVCDGFRGSGRLAFAQRGEEFAHGLRLIFSLDEATQEREIQIRQQSTLFRALVTTRGEAMHGERAILPDHTSRTPNCA